MKKVTERILTIFIAVFVVSFLLFSIGPETANAAFSTPTCAAGDGCLPDCGDPDCNPSTCNIAGSGGLIPCGKNCNDPDTPWTETRPCDLCSLFLMGQLIIEFMVRLSGAIALIAIAIGGFLYVFAGGSSSGLEKAKSMIKYSLLGFIVVFVAWAVVDSILITTGYIDPVGGEWYTIECTK